MNYKVVYFSRSGNSKSAAQRIAEGLSCEVIEITDGVDWSGILGYIKAGFYSVRKKDVPIKIHGNIKDTDEVVLVAPLWAGGLANAAMTFLKSFPRDRVHLVVTSHSSTVKDYEGFKSVNGIVAKQHNEDAVIRELVGKLT